MPLNFITVPLIGLVIIVLIIIALPSVVKATSLTKHIDATTQAFMKAIMLSAAILFLVYNALRTIFF
jgi:hypothetical protein